MGDMHTILHEMTDAFEGAMNEKDKWRLMFMCYDALIFLLEGNYSQALAKIQDLRTQHTTSAIVHRCYAEILARSFNEPDLEDDELQRRRDEAIREARTAVSLAPHDAEMARFLARMLLTKAKTRQDFEEVSRICETMLVILNPVAHGLERLEANSESVFPEDRLEMILIDLQILKSNSTAEADRIKLPPSMAEKIREAEVEDPCSSEQQQRKSSARASESSNEIFSAGERTNIDRRRNLVRSYLNSMTVEEKKALLRVKTSDLRILFEFLGEDSKRLATAVLFEALMCAELTRNWSNFKCRDCGRKFLNAKLLIQHSLQGHIGKLIPPEAKSLLPNKEWIEMLLDDPPSSSDVGASDDITSYNLDAFATLALLDVEERDNGGEEDQSQASNSDFIISFDRNSSFLVLHEQKLPNGIDVEGFFNSLVDELEERGFPDTCEALRIWSNRVYKADKPKALFMSLKKELAIINLNLEKKCEHLKYIKELSALAEQYAEEGVHDEGDIGFSENYWALIRKQLGDKEAFAGNRFKMEALSNILKDADSQEPDSEDRFPRAVFGRQMNKAEEELKKFRAELEPKLDHVEQLLYKELVPTSTVEYEAILLTLLKSYMQKWLEDSAEQKDFLKVYTASEAAKATRTQLKKKGKSGSHAL